MDEAFCCLCFPIKIGLYICAFYFIIEELLAVPEFIEFALPLWYNLCLGLSLVPGFMVIYYYVLWMREDNKENREGLIFAFKLKWCEHAFDGLFHLTFLASLSEEDFLKFTRPVDDPYRHTDYTGKYQMAAFFSAFIWNCLDLLLMAYLLNEAHIY